MAEDKVENKIILPFSLEKEKKTIKETVGQASHRLLCNKDTKQGIVDTQREVDKGYFEECQKCIERKPHSEWKDPWYLIVINKKERLMENVVRRYFFGRQSLPTPEYDQTVWKFYPQSGNLRYVWTIPCKNTCLWMYNNQNEIPEEHKELGKFVVDFMENRLYDVSLKIV